MSTIAINPFNVPLPHPHLLHSLLSRCTSSTRLNHCCTLWCRYFTCLLLNYFPYWALFHFSKLSIDGKVRKNRRSARVRTDALIELACCCFTSFLTSYRISYFKAPCSFNTCLFLKITSTMIHRTCGERIKVYCLYSSAMECNTFVFASSCVIYSAMKDLWYD